MPRVEVLTEVSERDPEVSLSDHTSSEMLAGEDDADQFVERVGWGLVDAERTARSHQRDTEASMIEFLARRPGSTAGDLAKGLNLNPGNVATRLTQLANAGEIKRASHGYRTRQAPRPPGHERPVRR